MGRIGPWGAAALALGTASPVLAEPAEDARSWSLSGSYTSGLIGTAQGAGGAGVDLVHHLELAASGSSWKNGRVQLVAIANWGGRPNERAGTLQGVDNMEVGRRGVRLLEGWAEQQLGPRTSLRAGVTDLNSEFYATEASGLLVAPSFGIGSELAATGSGGPSIFPSTALSLRLDHRVGGAGLARAALFNARAGTLGDEGGLNLGFDEGLLAIAEGGIERSGLKLMAGAWRYSRRQPDAPERSQGAYLLAEAGLGGGWSAFARGGLSDGRTGPFRASWQAGLLARPLFAGREDSAFSLGLHGARLSAPQRAELAGSGIAPARSETGIELTVADRPASWLALQPSVQWIRHPGGDRHAPAALVAGLRASVDF